MEKADFKILVVDDEPGMRNFLAYDLRTRGFFVTVAADGPEALGVLKADGFHLVLSDFKMPKMNGLELFEAVKHFNREIDFVIMTGYGTSETLDAALREGAMDVIQKPFHLKQIYELVEKAMRKHLRS